MPLTSGILTTSELTGDLRWNELDCLKQCNSSRKLLLYVAALMVLGLEALFLFFANAFYIVPLEGMESFVLEFSRALV